jgi:hypothetical protein
MPKPDPKRPTAKLIEKTDDREVYMAPEPTLDEYLEIQPAIHMVRIMYRFFDEVVDLPPFRSVHTSLLTAYEKILNEELAPYALNLASAIAELEDAYPEITSGRG